MNNQLLEDSKTALNRLIDYIDELNSLDLSSQFPQICIDGWEYRHLREYALQVIKDVNTELAEKCLDGGAKCAGCGPNECNWIGPGEELPSNIVLGRGNKASVCHWDLMFYFLTKEQCITFINEYLSTVEYPAPVRYEHEAGDSLTPDKHIVHIEDGAWADNLAEVAQMIRKVDYRTS